MSNGKIKEINFLNGLSTSERQSTIISRKKFKYIVLFYNQFMPNSESTKPVFKSEVPICSSHRCK